MTNIPEGVYSETQKQVIGTMGTSRTQVIINYYHCKSISENMVEIQFLDIYGDKLPLVQQVGIEEFLQRFKYEPDKFQNKKSPKELETDKYISQAENHIKRKEYNSAEYEYSKALKLDIENVKANFGLGKLYTLTGELEKAKEVFQNLSQQDNILDPQNKHIFNELGIELRTLKLYSEAILFYEKALAISSKDENLYFNIARAYLEKGDNKNALIYANKSLEINPNLDVALKMKESIH